MHRGVEGQIIEEPVYLPVFEKFGRLSLSFDEFERFPRLNVWSVGILERAAVIIGILILRGGIDILLFVIGESQCEIRRIPRHRGFALHVETEIRYRKALLVEIAKLFIESLSCLVATASRASSSRIS